MAVFPTRFVLLVACAAHVAVPAGGDLTPDYPYLFNHVREDVASGLVRVSARGAAVVGRRDRGSLHGVGGEQPRHILRPGEEQLPRPSPGRLSRVGLSTKPRGAVAKVMSAAAAVFVAVFLLWRLAIVFMMCLATAAESQKGATAQRRLSESQGQHRAELCSLLGERVPVSSAAVDIHARSGRPASGLAAVWRNHRRIFLLLLTAIVAVLVAVIVVAAVMAAPGKRAAVGAQAAGRTGDLTLVTPVDKQRAEESSTKERASHGTTVSSTSRATTMPTTPRPTATPTTSQTTTPSTSFRTTGIPSTAETTATFTTPETTATRTTSARTATPATSQATGLRTTLQGHTTPTTMTTPATEITARMSFKCTPQPSKQCEVAFTKEQHNAKYVVDTRSDGVAVTVTMTFPKEFQGRFQEVGNSLKAIAEKLSGDWQRVGLEKIYVSNQDIINVPLPSGIPPTVFTTGSSVGRRSFVKYR